jgi:lipopolysaccharide cholinephosphotransferase
MTKLKGGISELRLVQLLILTALQELARVCRILKVDYFAIAGTLLGAHRHGGFIPWDTDADVGMFRDDYEEFLARANKVIGPDFIVQSDVNDINNPNCFARIRLKGTKVCEIGNEPRGEFSGLYVDIFPIDNAKNKPRVYNIIIQKIVKIMIRVKAFRAGKKRSSTGLRTLIGYLLNLLFFLVPTTYLKSLLDRYMQRDQSKKTRLVTNYNSKYGIKKQTMPRDVYGIPLVHQFEGFSISTPQFPVKWLEKIYGDYMKIPTSPSLNLDELLPSYSFDFGAYTYLLELNETETRRRLGLPTLSTDNDQVLATQVSAESQSHLAPTNMYMHQNRKSKKVVIHRDSNLDW